MPYCICDATFRRKLSIRETNADYTRRYIERGVDHFKLPDWVTPFGYKLVKSKQDNQYRLLCNESGETVYVVKLIFRTDIVVGHKTCTQVMVWRTSDVRHEMAVQGLAKQFFAYFLNQYTVVVTDEQQTLEGQSFWERRVSWALNNQFYVYVSDGGEEDRPLTRVKDYDNFYLQWTDFCWGKDPDVHTHRLVVISTESLI